VYRSGSEIYSGDRDEMFLDLRTIGADILDRCGTDSPGDTDPIFESYPTLLQYPSD